MVGKLCFTTSLKATAVRNKVMVTVILSAVPLSMVNAANVKLMISN